MWLIPAALMILGALSGECADQDGWVGCADAAITGDHVEISAGRGGDAIGGGEGARGSLDEASDDVGDGIHCDDPLGRCGVFEVVVRREPSLSDVASFAPDLGTVVPEPAGFGVVGLPVNVVAAAGTSQREGELFELPVTVRFEPVSFRFDYGDGATRDVASGGATWEASGAAQFTPTDTSHVYAERGTYTVRAAVSFRVDVDFGGGWERVPGVLVLPAGESTVEVFEAHTALVERSCHEDPHGTGC